MRGVGEEQAILMREISIHFSPLMRAISTPMEGEATSLILMTMLRLI